MLSREQKEKQRAFSPIKTCVKLMMGIIPVSYTHLDVYKRQRTDGVYDEHSSAGESSDHDCFILDHDTFDQ